MIAALQTVDVVVNLEDLVENADAAWAITAACGLSFCSSAAADAAAASAADAVTTAACGSSFCSSAAAAWAVDAAVSTADANPLRKPDGVHHSVRFFSSFTVFE